MLAWIEAELSRGLWKEALLTALVLFTAWLCAQVYVWVVDRVTRRFAQRTAFLLDDQILVAIRRPGFLLLLLSGVYAAIHRYEFRLRGFLDGVIFALSVAVVIFAMIRIVAVLLQWYGLRVGEAISREVLPVADKFLKILLVVIGLLIILDHFNIEVSSILVTLGVGSLAIGLALQDTLANMFGGFTIMLDRPFRVGDRIQLQSGELGDVQSIGLRVTNLLMLNGNLLIVPNSHLVRNILTNYSLPDSRSQVIIDLGVAYGSNPETVKAIMLEVARQQPAVIGNPVVFFKDFGGYALTFMLVCQVRSFNDVMTVRDAINSGIGVRFEREGIDIPYPIQSVRLEGSAGPQSHRRGTEDAE
jgi:small-conductance mechanosensitive channel